MISSVEGRVPPPLSEEQLKELILKAIDDGADQDNPETFHALWGHPERGIQTDDVIYGLEQEWEFERPPVFNQDFWQWKYYIATRDIDSRLITIVIAVDTIDKSFEVISRWRRR